MTRFWISLEQGVNFVLTNFKRMHGGEIFIPKIPSVRIIDLAEAIAPGMPTHVVGIRPGEKLHEIMCPADDSHLTYDFSDHYVIAPTIRFHNGDVDFSLNALGDQGVHVGSDFEYHSGTNPHFLSVEETRTFNAGAKT
jgi:UDP-N-acetylglucosamine 4,6-dehydratase